MRKQMRKQAGMLLLAGLLAACVPVTAEEVTTEEETQEAVTEVLTEEVATDTAQGEASLEDAKWNDYVVSVDGDILTFPMPFETFAAFGWEAEDDTAGYDLEPRQYDMLYYSKDGRELMVYVINFDNRNLPVEECIVGGISFDSYYWDASEGEVLLPGGIRRGVSTLEDIQAAFGTPNDTYEGTFYTQVTYETDIYEEVQLQVGLESGVLEDVTLRNFTVPDGFVYSEVSAEPPERVAAYEMPETLSDSLDSYQIQVGESVYALPIPVSALMEDGWEIVADDSQESIAAHDSGWVTLVRDNRQIRDLADNPEDVAVTPENAWFTEISLGIYDLDVEGSIPGGIAVGMSEEDLVKVLDEAGVSYEVNGDDYRYYRFQNESYGHYYEAVVYGKEDDYYEKDTIMTLTCANDF